MSLCGWEDSDSREGLVCSGSRIASCERKVARPPANQGSLDYRHLADREHFANINSAYYVEGLSLTK